MSCDIANGRLEACKDSIAGLDAIYIINYGDYNPDSDITFDGTYEDLINAVTGVANLYKYELKGANSFDQAITSSRDNGTTYFEQTLAVTLKKQDVQTHKTIKLLAYGRPHIVVRNRNNQFFLAGLNRGMDVTAGSVANGTAMGDLSGYTLTFTGMENVPANFLDCATEAELATLFASATIVSA
jgi:hypothetical protein